MPESAYNFNAKLFVQHRTSESVIEFSTPGPNAGIVEASASCSQEGELSDTVTDVVSASKAAELLTHVSGCCFANCVGAGTGSRCARVPRQHCKPKGHCGCITVQDGVH